MYQIKKVVMDSFRRLSDIVGIDSIGWRYDPIMVDATHTVEWHISEFEKSGSDIEWIYKNMCNKFYRYL